MSIETNLFESDILFQQPLVSVLVPSYQASSYLSLLVKSVLAQTYENWELLILDDGSGDLDYPDVKIVLKVS